MTTAILDTRPVARLAPARPSDANALVRRLGLDGLSRPRALACHWQRDAEGRLSCFWEPDFARDAER